MNRLYKIGDVVNGYEIVETNYKSKNLYGVKCKKCGEIYFTSTKNLQKKKKIGCKKCSLRNDFTDIIGKRFGCLTVETLVGESDYANDQVYSCKCDCGNIVERNRRYLYAKILNYCPKCVKNKPKDPNKPKPVFNTPLYRVWIGMKRRCYYEKGIEYKNYGARGIIVCDEWKNNFNAFKEWALANGYTQERFSDKRTKYSIDRIDVNGDYEPSNCCWATYKTQSNNRTNNHYIEYNGEKKTVTEWSEIYNIPTSRLITRLKYGYSFEEAVKDVNYRKKTKYTLFGEPHSVDEICKIIGFSYYRWWIEYKNGLTPDEMYEKYKKQK